MDTPKTLTQEEALDLVRAYKRLIAPRFNNRAKVYMYGSYSKGYANPWSDIDVAVIVPSLEGGWLQVSTDITMDAFRLSTLIEPVLMTEDEPSPLYRDVMRTGIAV
ncbi:MAG: nucleotidyltransferase domain-containing protein [Bacteroidaceae bacterium]|nr:nucleotidyltransferase domain-containing protein [Bacteroidaceae bacterium]